VRLDAAQAARCGMRKIRIRPLLHASAFPRSAAMFGMHASEIEARHMHACRHSHGSRYRLMGAAFFAHASEGMHARMRLVGTGWRRA
jgi:hypothetical protein